MCDLLIEGRRANNGTYYVHVGDFSWWMYHHDVTQWKWIDRTDLKSAFARRIFLWNEGARLLGWCLLTPDGGFIDVFVRPDERGGSREEAMFAWSEERLIELAPGIEQISSMWVAENDLVRRGLLERRGYTVSPRFMLYLARPLTDPVPTLEPPLGFTLRSVQGLHEAQKRAAAAHASFKSPLPIDHHRQRYLSFMQSPVYDRERDLVVMAPDGRVASFCIIWTDEINLVGLFEPFGTHPEFRGLGLGSSLLRFALAKMLALGLRTAIVCPNGDNSPAIQLYKSHAFKLVHRLLLYAKAI